MTTIKTFDSMQAKTPVLIFLSHFVFYSDILCDKVIFVNIMLFDKLLLLSTASQLTFTYSKLTMETLEEGVFIVKFENISHLVLVFL